MILNLYIGSGGNQTYIAIVTRNTFFKKGAIARRAAYFYLMSAFCTSFGKAVSPMRLLEALDQRVRGVGATLAPADIRTLVCIELHNCPFLRFSPTRDVHIGQRPMAAGLALGRFRQRPAPNRTEPTALEASHRAARGSTISGPENRSTRGLTVQPCVQSYSYNRYYE